MNVKIKNKFIEIKYSVSNGPNYRWFRILEISNVVSLRDKTLVEHCNTGIVQIMSSWCFCVVFFSAAFFSFLHRQIGMVVLSL